jgi:hypothetical protein
MLSAFRRLVRYPAELLSRFASTRSPVDDDLMQSRSELSNRFIRELREMVDDREISVAAARRIADDMFEAEEAGQPRRVRLAVWQSYLKDRTGHAGPYLVRRNRPKDRGHELDDEADDD